MKRIIRIVLYSIFAATVIAVGTECLAQLLYYVQKGAWYDPQVVFVDQEMQFAMPQARKYGEGASSFGIHPYFGYTLAPAQSKLPWTEVRRTEGEDLDRLILGLDQAQHLPGPAYSFQTAGEDPKVVLDARGLPPAHRWRVRVLLESSRQDRSILFFAAEGEAFHDEASVTRPVAQGLNSLIFELPPGVTPALLRLDPGRGLGTYRLQQLAFDSQVEGDPENDAARAWYDATQGFAHNESPLFPTLESTERPAQLRVLLTGGSVALQLASHALPFKQALQRKLDAAGVPLQAQVFTAALGGYKQPQQLFAALYFLIQGASFDLVVNLDGFNDGVLPVHENLQEGINPFYPRKWDLRFLVKRLARDLADVESLQERRQQLLDQGRHSLWLRLASLGIVQEYCLQQNRAAFRAAMQRMASAQKDFDQIGPAVVGDEAAVLDQATALWARASQAMHAVCSVFGAEYYHFLQPNQYVENSKPFSEQEKQEFVLPDGYGPTARRVYPLLQAQGRTLAAAGVPFEDLTALFNHEERTVYLDSCCHFNELGQHAIATRMVEDIAARSPWFKAETAMRRIQER